MLKEVRLSEKKKERIDAFLKEVNQRIRRVPSVTETEVRRVVWGTGRHLTLCCSPKRVGC